MLKIIKSYKKKDKSNKEYMIIEELVKDLSDICLSYLSQDEQIYIKKEWDKFDKKYICTIAAKNGWIDLLIWARNPHKQSGSRAEWNSWTCSYAAGNGHLLILQWARENGCEWDSSTCSLAAENGHLEVLKWARQNGCDWDRYTCSNAAANGIA
jgi:hypothetical protein